MKNKEAENNLEKVLQLLNKHPNFTEFKVTENWENQLKKIIKYLLFFISDMNLNNIQIENEQNKLE
jgi:hypothetical protein